jgi:hypothetical protein
VRPERLAVAVALALAALAGCGGADAPPLAPDPALVRTLAELHLADARAELTGADPESLRAVAYRARGTDSATVARALDAVARDPAAAEALWSAVAAALETERLGTAGPAAGAAHTNEHTSEVR